MEKTVYAYDSGGIFLGETILNMSDINPVSGDFLIPANCTEETPLAEKEGFFTVFDGEKWKYEKIPQPTKEELKKTKELIYNSKTNELFSAYQKADFMGDEVEKKRLKEEARVLKEKHEAAE